MPDCRDELLIDGQWIDITGDVRESDAATIIRGRRDEGSRTDRGRCILKLNNRHGKYSDANPSSPYFGLLGRNTRLRRWVRGDQPYLYISGATGARARVASTAALDVTSDLDVRVELSLDRLPALFSSVTEQVTEIVGRYNATGIPGNRMWRLLVTGFGRLAFAWSTNGDDILERASTIALPHFAGQRFALRATIDVDNGAGGHTVTFYTAPTLTGPWEPLGDPVVTAGTTSINQVGDASLELGNINTIIFSPGAGRYYGVELRDGINGPLLASPDFTAQTPGSTGFTDTAGRTWELQGAAEITDFYRRFYGEIPAWPQHWDQSGNDSWVNIEASGILRRLSQGQKALQSTLRQRIPSAVPPPRAYWALEDGDRTISPGSPIAGVPPLDVAGFRFGSDSSLGGSDSLPTLSNPASLTGSVPGAVSGGWHAEMVYNLATMPTTERTMLRLNVSGAGSGVAAVRVRCSTAGIRVQALDDDDAVVAFFLFTNADAIADFTGGWNRLALYSFDDGPACHVVAQWRDVVTDVFWRASTSFSGPPGRVTSVRGIWGSDFNGMGIGHLGVWDVGGSGLGLPGVTIYAGADDGFAGESAVGRIRRIAGEQDLEVTATGIPADASPVGPQRIASAMDVIRDCEAVDMGVLVEQRETLGLQYLARTSLYNRRPSLILDHALAELGAPLDPTKDDQRVRNEIVVKRDDGGSSAPARQETGPLAVDSIGLYDEEVPLNLATDEQTDPAAGWLLHLHTVDEARVPVVVINLANPRMAAHRQTVLDRVDQQSLLVIRNSLYGPDDLRLIIEGYTERISKTSWLLELNCSPASPWTVGVVEDTENGHADTGGSVLAAAVTSTTTLLPVTETDGRDWVTGSVAYSGATATGAGGSLTPGYLVCTDADAADIAVSDTARLFDSADALKESTTFTVTGKPSAFGFTNVEFTPDAAAVTETGDQLRVGAFTGSAEDFPFDVRVGGEVVTVTGIADAITDSFSRTAASSWGVADTGQAWTNSGGAASDFSVSSGAGRHSVGTLSVSRFSVVPAAGADFDVQVSVSTPVLPTGDNQQAYLVARYLDASNYYAARVDFTPAATVTIAIVKVVAGTPTAFTVVVTGLTHVANTLFRIRFQGVGSALKAKVWAASGTEPAGWDTEVTDGALTAAGSVGVRTRFLGGTTNPLPVVVSFDDFASPQAMTVVRSVNTVEKSHAPGADARLDHPAIVAL